MASEESDDENPFEEEPNLPTSEEMIVQALNEDNKLKIPSKPTPGFGPNPDQARETELTEKAEPTPYHLLPDTITEQVDTNSSVRLDTIQKNFKEFWDLLDAKLDVEEWLMPDPENPMRSYNYRDWFNEVRRLFFDEGMWRKMGKQAIEMHAEVVTRMHDINSTKHTFGACMFTFIKAMTDELRAREKLIEIQDKELEKYRKAALEKYEDFVRKMEAHVASEKIEARQTEQSAIEEQTKSDREHEKLQILAMTWDKFMDYGVNEQQWLDYKKSIGKRIQQANTSKAKSMSLLFNSFKKDNPLAWERVAYCQVLNDASAQISERFSSEHAANILKIFVDFARLSLNNYTSAKNG